MTSSVAVAANIRQYQAWGCGRLSDRLCSCGCEVVVEKEVILSRIPKIKPATMFLSFGKKSPSVKKHGSPEESTKVARSPEAKITAEAMNGSLRSTTVQTTAGPLLSSSRFNSILDAS